MVAKTATSSGCHWYRSAPPAMAANSCWDSSDPMIHNERYQYMNSDLIDQIHGLHYPSWLSKNEGKRKELSVDRGVREFELEFRNIVAAPFDSRLVASSVIGTRTQFIKLMCDLPLLVELV